MSKKSIIAKLLSEEDISVVHKKTKTAAFNVQNRELILPIWKEEMSKDISDLFICHEIGHALYTSQDMIQKMIKRKDCSPNPQQRDTNVCSVGKNAIREGNECLIKKHENIL